MENGERLGGYRVRQRLGAGGMGEVYEAEDAGGARVALKVFAADGAKADFFRRRFLAEARLLSRLSHPRLVKVREFGVDAATGRPFLAMDLVLNADGRARTLAEVMPDEADEARLASWFRDLASVIDYIHSQGVVHRDVKLNNVLLDSGGRAVLADFGISRVCDEELRREIDITKTMVTGSTCERHVLGTRGYMSPEILRGEDATAASDAYALAASFFRLLTGVWYDPNLGAGGAHGAGRHVLGLADMLDSFEYNWTDVLGAMLSADAAQRATELAPLAAKLKPKEQAPAASAGTRRAWPWVAAFAAAVVVAIAVAALLPRKGAAPVATDATTVTDTTDAANVTEAPKPPRRHVRPFTPGKRQKPKITDGLFDQPGFLEN